MKPTQSEDLPNSVATSVALLLPALLSLHKQNIDKMIQPFGISSGQSTLLMLLSQNDGQRQTDLARQLNVKAPSLTTMINRMEKANLLIRIKSDDDHRTCKVYLTNKGRRASKRMNAVIRFLNERNLAGFRQEEKLLFLRFLEHMAENLEKQKNELAMIRMDELTARRSNMDNEQ